MRHAAALITALSLLAAGATLHAEDGAKPALTQNGPEVQPTGELKVGDRIQPFTLPLLGGGEVSWPKDLKDQVLVVNFWATWCAPCRKEMPGLDRLQGELGGDDFQVVTLATGRNSPTAIRRFFTDENIAHLPQFNDRGQTVARDMGVLGLPVTAILNRDGQEIARLRGDADWESHSAKAILLTLIDQDRTPH